MSAAPIPRKPSLGYDVFAVLAIFCAMAAGLMALKASARPPQQEALQAVRPLPAFIVIKDADLGMTRLTGLPPGAVVRKADAVGKVTTQALAAGAVLPAAGLVTVPAGWQLLEAPISTTLTLVPGETLVLIGAAGESAVTGGADGVQVSAQALGLGQEGGTVVLALPAEEALAAAAYLMEGRRLLLARPLQP